MTNKIYFKTKSLMFFLIILFITGFTNFSIAAEDEDILKAKKTYEKGDPKAAIKSLSFLMKMGSQVGTVKKDKMVGMYYLVAKIYFETKEFTKADENLKRLFDLSPDFKQEETNADFKIRVNAIRDKRKKTVKKLEIEFTDVIKTVDKINISPNVSVKFDFDKKVKLVGEPKRMAPRPGYIYVKMVASLINNSDEEIYFKLNNLKMINASGKPSFLLYHATFDNGKQSHTIHNINTPTVLPESKNHIELLAIVEKECPKLTFQYRGGTPVPVQLSSLVITTLGQKKPKEEIQVKTTTIKTVILGKKLSIKFKGKKITVYLQKIIPGIKNKYLASAYFDKLPPKIQKIAKKRGYKPGDAVRFSLGEKKGSTKILPSNK